MTAKVLTPLAFISLCLTLTHCSHGDWRTAERGSAGLAPLPHQHPEALVQLYAARAVSWRGYFAVHSWLVTKEKNADHFMTYHVVGFRLKRGGSAVIVGRGIPDAHWYGAKPDLLRTVAGEEAEAAIPKIRRAVASYPYHHAYRVWPGPNSNTFISHILRQVPEIGVELPPNAIGKDWLPGGGLFGKSETGTGFQVSALGVLGLTLGISDGIEIDLLGMSFGIDLIRPALKLPFIGRLGIDDAAL